MSSYSKEGGKSSNKKEIQSIVDEMDDDRDSESIKLSKSSGNASKSSSLSKLARKLLFKEAKAIFFRVFEVLDTKIMMAFPLPEIETKIDLS